MAIRTELSVRLPNSPGALAEVCSLLGDDRVRLLALMLEPSGVLRLVVDNPVRAAGLLRSRRHVVVEKDVVVTPIPNTPGGLASALALLRTAGVNIDYVYCAAPDPGTISVAVLGVEDAVRASAAAGL